MVSLSPTIGKIFGIPIQLHWTFLGLMLLALILLATSPGGLFFFALLVLLFVCVLIHELAHSVVAIRNDIKVKKIILLPIGGASIIDFTKVKPGKELKISLAGPLTSIALGLIFVPFYLIAPGAGILKQGLQFLFEINLLLGVFNLLPGFPLDGGRVLRSYLERRHSPLDSTKIAVKASNIVVVGIVVGTIIYAAVIPNATFTYREFLVLFDVIIALFLYDGAKAELQSAIFKSRARNVAAADAATKNFILVTPQMRLSSLYKEMVRKGTNIVLLKKGNRFFAFSGRLSANSDMGDHTISEKEGTMFKSEVPKIDGGRKLSDAIELMQVEEKNTVVVIKNKRLVGVLYAPYVEAAIQLYLSKKKQ